MGKTVRPERLSNISRTPLNLWADSKRGDEMVFFGQTAYSEYQMNGQFQRLENQRPDLVFLQMEPRRARSMLESEVLNNDDDYIELFKTMGGLSEVEFQTMQKVFGFNFNSSELKSILRTQGLVPTREQHLTLLKLKELGIPQVCIDQNPFAMQLRWAIFDKAGSIHKLMMDVDISLADRVDNFMDEEMRKQSDMKACRASFQKLAQDRQKQAQGLGLNQQFDDSCTKQDTMLFNVSMQFNTSSWAKGYYYPRIQDNLRMVHQQIDEEDTPKKQATFLGVMNLFNTKDQFLLNRPDFWNNPQVDMSLDRDAVIEECNLDIMPTCHPDLVNQFGELYKEGCVKLDLDKSGQ